MVLAKPNRARPPILAAYYVIDEFQVQERRFLCVIFREFNQG